MAQPGQAAPAPAGAPLANMPETYVGDLRRVEHMPNHALYQCMKCTDTYHATGPPTYAQRTWMVLHNGGQLQVDLFKGCLTCNAKVTYALTSRPPAWAAPLRLQFAPLAAAALAAFLRGQIPAAAESLEIAIGNLNKAKLLPERATHNIPGLVSRLTAALSQRLPKKEKGVYLEPAVVLEEYHKAFQQEPVFRRFCALREFASTHHPDRCWPETLRVWQSSAAATFPENLLLLDQYFIGPVSTAPANRSAIFPKDILEDALAKLEAEFWSLYAGENAGKNLRLAALVDRLYSATQMPQESTPDFLRRFTIHLENLEARRPPGSQPLPSWLVEILVLKALNPHVVARLVPPPVDGQPFEWKQDKTRTLLSDAEDFLRRTKTLPLRLVESPWPGSTRTTRETSTTTTTRGTVSATTPRLVTRRKVRQAAASVTAGRAANRTTRTRAAVAMVRPAP